MPGVRAEMFVEQSLDVLARLEARKLELQKGIDSAKAALAQTNAELRDLQVKSLREHAELVVSQAKVETIRNHEQEFHRFFWVPFFWGGVFLLGRHIVESLDGAIAEAKMAADNLQSLEASMLSQNRLASTRAL